MYYFELEYFRYQILLLIFYILLLKSWVFTKKIDSFFLISSSVGLLKNILEICVENLKCCPQLLHTSCFSHKTFSKSLGVAAVEHSKALLSPVLRWTEPDSYLSYYKKIVRWYYNLGKYVSIKLEALLPSIIISSIWLVFSVRFLKKFCLVAPPWILGSYARICRGTSLWCSLGLYHHLASQMSGLGDGISFPQGLCNFVIFYVTL